MTAWDPEGCFGEIDVPGGLSTGFPSFWLGYGRLRRAARGLALVCAIRVWRLLVAIGGRGHVRYLPARFRPCVTSFVTAAGVRRPRKCASSFATFQLLAPRHASHQPCLDSAQTARLNLARRLVRRTANAWFRCGVYGGICIRVCRRVEPEINCSTLVCHHTAAATERLF